MESTTRIELFDAIGHLNDEQVEDVFSMVRGLLVGDADPVRKRLLRVPGIKLPVQWPPRFEAFEPIKLEGEGELPSTLLVRERR